MPIGFVCHVQRGADNRKIFSSDIHKRIDALIFSGFRQCERDTNSVSPQFHPTPLVGSVNNNQKYIFINCTSVWDKSIAVTQY